MAKSVARGKALLLKLRADPGVADAEALAAWAGRTKLLRKAGVPAGKARLLALKKGGLKEGGVKSGGGNGGGKKPPVGGSGSFPPKEPNPSERFNDLPDDVSEKQGAYLRSLLDKDTPDTYPNSITGEPQMLGNRKIGEYSILLNMPKPKSRREVSNTIDALKNGGPTAYARNNRGWFQGIAGKLTKKYGSDLSGLKDAAAKRYQALPTTEKIRMQDDRRAYLREIINPLLKV